MKRFTVPADIQLHEPTTGERIDKPIPFRAYALKAWLNDKRMGSSPVALARLARFLPRFIEAKAGDVIELEDADHELLASIAREPEATFGPIYAVQLLPFASALLGAE